MSMPNAFCPTRRRCRGSRSSEMRLALAALVHRPRRPGGAGRRRAPVAGPGRREGVLAHASPGFVSRAGRSSCSSSTSGWTTTTSSSRATAKGSKPVTFAMLAPGKLETKTLAARARALHALLLDPGPPRARDGGVADRREVVDRSPSRRRIPLRSSVPSRPTNGSFLLSNALRSVESGASARMAPASPVWGRPR